MSELDNYTNRKPNNTPEESPTTGRDNKKRVGDLWAWVKTHTSMLLFFILSAVVILAFAFLYNWNATLLVAVPVLLVILILTRDVRTSSGRIAVLRVGYLFAIMISVLAVLLLFYDRKPLIWPDDSGQSNKVKYRIVGLAVLPGCDFAVRDSRVEGAGENELVDASMPRSAEYCGNLPPQWVLAIGGLVLDCHVDGSCHKPHKQADQDRLEQLNSQEADDCKLDKDNCLISEVAFVNRIRELKGETHELKSIRNAAQLELKILSLEPASESNLRLQKAKHTEVRMVDRAIDERENKKQILEKNLEAFKKKDKKNQTELLDIENNIAPARPIVGGLVVPLYFLALAFVGALVSMFRKLPEFQFRNDSAYENKLEIGMNLSSTHPPAVADSQLPELVIFQMVQVLTAAPVAILAYAWVDPSNLANSIALAFVAGFSSELILIGARKFVASLIENNQPYNPRRVIESAYKLTKDLAQANPAAESPSRTTVTINGMRLSNGDSVQLREEVITEYGVKIPVGTTGTINSLNEDSLTVSIVGHAKPITKPDRFFELESTPLPELVRFSG